MLLLKVYDISETVMFWQNFSDKEYATRPIAISMCGVPVKTE